MEDVEMVHWTLKHLPCSLINEALLIFRASPDSLFISVILPFVFAFPFPPEATTLSVPVYTLFAGMCAVQSHA